MFTWSQRKMRNKADVCQEGRRKWESKIDSIPIFSIPILLSFGSSRFSTSILSVRNRFQLGSIDSNRFYFRFFDSSRFRLKTAIRFDYNRNRCIPSSHITSEVHLLEQIVISREIILTFTHAFVSSNRVSYASSDVRSEDWSGHWGIWRTEAQKQVRFSRHIRKADSTQTFHDDGSWPIWGIPCSCALSVCSSTNAFRFEPQRLKIPCSRSIT